MDKPKVFANPINKKIINSQEVFYEKKPDVRQDNYDSYNVLKKINDIFNSSHHVYKSKVSILTKDGEIVGDIIGKTENSLLTLEKYKILSYIISSIYCFNILASLPKIIFS